MDDNAQVDVNIRNAIGLVFGIVVPEKIYTIFEITPTIRLNAAQIPSIH